MKNRVKDGEEVQFSIIRIPFLKRFSRKYVSFLNNCPFDFCKINEYMGYDYLNSDSPFTASSINIVLEEAERRGDI